MDIMDKLLMITITFVPTLKTHLMVTNISGLLDLTDNEQNQLQAANNFHFKDI